LHQDAEVLLLDEPTRGIDVGSRAQIYEAIARCVAQGKAVLLVSSYLPELFGVCDRLAVMSRGRLSPARPIEQWTPETVLATAIGGASAGVLRPPPPSPLRLRNMSVPSLPQGFLCETYTPGRAACAPSLVAFQCFSRRSSPSPQSPDGRPPRRPTGPAGAGARSEERSSPTPTSTPSPTPT